MGTSTTSGITIEPAGAGWRLACAQRVPRPLAEVFSFFATARNLERLTPAFLHFRILRSSSEPLAEGARIDYALRLHGLPVRWRTRIDEWDPPRRFVDRQVRGPYRTWVHTHTFRALADGTLVSDVVRFDLYCRPLARTPVLGWIFADLRTIFEHRQREVQRVFGRAGWAEAAQRMRTAGDDQLADQPPATAFDDDEWEW